MQSFYLHAAVLARACDSTLTCTRRPPRRLPVCLLHARASWESTLARPPVRRSPLPWMRPEDELGARGAASATSTATTTGAGVEEEAGGRTAAMTRRSAGPAAPAAMSRGGSAELSARFADAINYAERRLNEYPVVQRAAAALGVRAIWVPVGAAAVLSMVFGMFDRLISNSVGFFYPAWQSFKAIESKDSTRDDTQWLTYWVVYAFFVFLEIFGDILLFWIPLYQLLKMCFLLWLFLPQFMGATTVYVYVVRPLLQRYESQVDEIIQQVGGRGRQLAEDLAAAGGDPLSAAAAAKRKIH